MVKDLNDVAEKVREVRELICRFLTTLKRPPKLTSDNVQRYIEDSDQIFALILEKTKAAQETLKNKLSGYCTCVTPRKLECQTSSFSTADKPETSLEMFPPTGVDVSVKLRPSVDTPEPSRSRQLGLSPTTHNTLDDKTRNYSSFTALPFKHGRNTRFLEPQYGNELDMTMDNNYADKMEQIEQPDQMSYASKFSDFTSGGSSLFTSLLGPAMSSVGQVDWRNQLQGFMQQQTQTYLHSHLIRFMAKQHDSDADFNTQHRRLTALGMETSNCMLRGFQQTPNILESDTLTTVFSFIPEVDKELEEVKNSQTLPGRGTGPDTVLCLDTSASMDGDCFQKMMTVVNSLINGIEELAHYENLEENIAVTTFGSNPRVVTHLTNDYKYVRDQIDFLYAEGPSPLYRGLAMSIAACIGNYSEVTVNDVRLMPRVIVVTDGKFSSYHRQTGQDSFDPMNTIMVPYAAKVMEMNGFVCYCVRIDASEDSEILKSLTQITGGKIFHHEHVDELAMMSRYLFAATRLLRQFPQLVDGDEEARTNDEVTFRALLDLERSNQEAFGREFSESEKKTVIDLAINISKRESTKVADQNDYHVKELPDLQLPPLGTRVRRGPDWNDTDNQDSNGPGTVVNHNDNGSVDVLWDCGIMPCTYHCNQPCHVLPSDSDERRVGDGELIQVGCKVIRGDGWNKGDEDGGPGVCGVVCMCTKKGIVTVRWFGGKIGKYRYGDEVKFLDTSDEYADAAEYHDTEITSKTKLNPDEKIHPTSHQSGESDSNFQFLKYETSNINVFSSETPVNIPLEELPIEQPEMSNAVMWSYQDGDRDVWTPFDANNTRKLESEWSNQRKTCLVISNRKRYRVVFAEMKMKSTPVHPVQHEKTLVTLNVKREKKRELEMLDESQSPEIEPAGTKE